MWNGKTVSVVLMTYAERDSIREVINGFLETGLVEEVLVVDNNAQQGTAEEVAKTTARLVREPEQGYGHATRRGLMEARGDLIVIAEPDGTFLPSDITKLLVYSDECDVVFGTRTTLELIWAGANMTWFLRWGNWAVAKMIEVLFNTSHLSDVGCTYRVLRRPTAEHVAANMTVGGNHAGVEIMLLTIVSGSRFIEVPVNYLPRVGVSSVTGRPVAAIQVGLRMIQLLLRLRGVSRRRPMRPPPRSVTRPPAVEEPMSATHFDDIATEYDDSLPAHVVEHYLRKRTAYVLEHCPLGRGLDVGCGTGVLAARLAGAGYQMTGVDPSDGMLDVMRAGAPQVEAVPGSGTALPFADDSFDLVMCVAVMHHVADPAAVRETLGEMVRVLRPGGRVVVWDHNPRNPYWSRLMAKVPQDTGEERLIPEQEVISGLVDGGGVVVRSTQLGMVPEFVPPAALRAAAAAERVVERTPLVRRLAAHNVVLATKPPRSTPAPPA